MPEARKENKQKDIGLQKRVIPAKTADGWEMLFRGRSCGQRWVHIGAS